MHQATIRRVRAASDDAAWLCHIHPAKPVLSA
jgi:hypothetical protein